MLAVGLCRTVRNATLFVGAIALASATPQYTIIDLSGGLNNSAGVKVNSSGAVAGIVSDGTTSSVARFQPPGTTSFASPAAPAGGSSSPYASGINNSGKVIGFANIYDSGGYNKGLDSFVFDGTTTQMLGNFGTDSSGYRYTYAAAINDAGQITGYSLSYDSAGSSQGYRAFLYNGSTMQSLGTLATDIDSNGFGWSYANGINASGQVAGTSYYYDGAGQYQGDRAFRYDGTSLQNLGSLGVDINGYGYSYGNFIDASGKVAGQSHKYDSSGNYLGNRAFLHDGTSMRDLGTLGVDAGGVGNAYAIALNNGGRVAGYSEVYDSGGNYRGSGAFLYDGSSMVNIGAALGTDSSGSGFSYAQDVNDAGQVLVLGDQYDNSGNHIKYGSFLYSGGVLYDLLPFLPNASGWTNLFANDISENGYITGFGIYNGQTRAFLLAPVPEPGYFVLLGVGLAGAFWHRRRRAV